MMMPSRRLFPQKRPLSRLTSTARKRKILRGPLDPPVYVLNGGVAVAQSLVDPVRDQPFCTTEPREPMRRRMVHGSGHLPKRKNFLTPGLQRALFVEIPLCCATLLAGAVPLACARKPVSEAPPSGGEYARIDLSNTPRRADQPCFSQRDLGSSVPFRYTSHL